MPAQPSLLFVAPILPAPGGNGLAMRAGVFLEALARDYAVTLLVVPVAGELGGTARRLAAPFVAEHAQRTVTVSLRDKVDPMWTLVGRVADPQARAAAQASYPRPALCRFATPACLVEAKAAAGVLRFDAIHVMRSYMAPYAEPFLAAADESVALRASLDLDDDEAATHRRLAGLAQRRGNPDEAKLAAAEALKYDRLETQWLPRFATLVACTHAHAALLAIRLPGCRVAVVPNTVGPAPPPPGEPPRDGGKRILFVGNLSYLPNVDGIIGFAREVLPRLRSRFGGEVTLRIAGSSPAAEVAALAALPGVELLADPPELASSYAWADLAVVPLAAGGGTRIKLLEAFAHGVPVVATAVGAEGIDARHGEHLLIADGAEPFADACVALLHEPVRAQRLAMAARALVDARYSREHGLRAVREALAPARAP